MAFSDDSPAPFGSPAAIGVRLKFRVARADDGYAAPRIKHLISYLLFDLILSNQLDAPLYGRWTVNWYARDTRGAAIVTF